MIIDSLDSIPFVHLVWSWERAFGVQALACPFSSEAT
jgi:hypothetical protein